MGEVSAFVLAGGQSSRMGTDKAFVELDGQPLITRALSLARALTSEVSVLGNKANFRDYGPVVEDEFPNHGPLGGIQAALRSSSAELNLILAVDMPFVEIRFLRYLLDEAREHSAVVTLPRAEGKWEPLCAIYRRPFAELAEQALKEDKNKIDPLFAQVELRILEEEELRRRDFSPGMFRNLNTPEDVRQTHLPSSRT